MDSWDPCLLESIEVDNYMKYIKNLKVYGSNYKFSYSTTNKAENSLNISNRTIGFLGCENADFK